MITKLDKGWRFEGLKYRGLASLIASIENRPDKKSILFGFAREQLPAFTKRKLLSTNYKIEKSNAAGSDYATVTLSLAPHKTSGVQLCPFASLAGCDRYCIGEFSGMNVNPANLDAKIIKTLVLHFFPVEFHAKLDKELAAHVRTCARKGLRPAARLNCYSDIDWTATVDKFADVQFYDYTKVAQRAHKNERPNYHLTLSHYENCDGGATNARACLEYLSNGGNVSVIFDDDMPDTWNMFPVIDGDETDLRFLDPAGVVVGLRIKGTNAAKSAHRETVTA